MQLLWGKVTLSLESIKEGPQEVVWATPVGITRVRVCMALYCTHDVTPGPRALFLVYKMDKME